MPRAVPVAPHLLAPSFERAVPGTSRLSTSEMAQLFFHFGASLQDKLELTHVERRGGWEDPHGWATAEFIVHEFPYIMEIALDNPESVSGGIFTPGVLTEPSQEVAQHQEPKEVLLLHLLHALLALKLVDGELTMLSYDEVPMQADAPESQYDPELHVFIEFEMPLRKLKQMLATLGEGTKKDQTTIRTYIASLVDAVDEIGAPECFTAESLKYVVTIDSLSLIHI